MTSIRSTFDLAGFPFAHLAANSENKQIEERNARTGEIKKYVRGNFLGKGGFARCYELTETATQKIHAAKIIPKSSLVKARAKSKLLSEIKIHHSLSHPHVVKFHHYFEDSENVYILLEVCQNQTLNDMIKRRKRVSDVELQNYLMQLIDGLRYLHSQRVIHRDLKLGNLFLSEKMELKLGDFGLATKLDFDGEKKKTICGTPNYIAPEILDGKCGHSYEADLWSVGVIAYTLLIGKPPFETSDVKTTYKRIKAVAYSFPDHIPISSSAKDIISRLLVREPEKRMSFDEIMSHEFMNPAYSIPKFLPVSTVAVPLNAAYIKSLASNKENRMVASDCERRSSIKNLKSSKETFNAEKKWNLDFDYQISPRVKSPRKICNDVKSCDVCVSDWIDYSNKYGVGYLLSSGIAGVYFNDATKMLIDGACKLFIYFDRKSGEKEDTATIYTTDGYPSDLHKKLTLLQHFKSHLEEKAGNVKSKGVLQASEGNKQIYVKKWLKTKHAILFRLSNKLVQVVFQDSTTIYLSTELKMVFYLNKKGEKLNFPLATAMESDNAEMVKRLKYTKNLLNLMLHKGGRIIEEDDAKEPLKSSATLRKNAFSQDKEDNGEIYRLSSLGRFSPSNLNKY